MADAALQSHIGYPITHNLFTDYAGTAVGSDLLVLQKDSSKTALHNSLEEEFMQTLGNERHITMNKLFARHDNLILHTSAKQDKDPYGKPAMIYTFDGTTEDMAGAINGILSRDMERRFDRELYLKNMSERKRHVSLTATARQFAVTRKTGGRYHCGIFFRRHLRNRSERNGTFLSAGDGDRIRQYGQRQPAIR